MMAEIIFWIAMVFFIVSPARSSQALRGNGTAELCDSGMVPAKDSDYSHSANNDGEAIPLPNPSTTDSRDIVNERMMICCRCFRNNDGTCKPYCSPKCENGECVQPNVCKCNKYWEGNFCNETHVCRITRRILVNGSKTESQNKTTYPLKEFKKLQNCLRECLNHLNNTRVTYISRSGNKTYRVLYLLPIDSPCNIEAPLWAFLKKWRYEIGGALGILLVTIVICVVCLVKRKPRMEAPEENAVTESEYDDVGIMRSMGIRPIPEYDDVNTWVISEYDDVNMQPISEYDDVGVGSHSEEPVYEYVG